MNKVKLLLTIGCALALTACAVPGKKAVLEQSKDKPTWVDSNKITWNDGSTVFIRSQYTIRGDERVNACYQLAKMDTKDVLLREISEDVRGQIDMAQQGISEEAEIILNQSTASEYGGKVTGFRFLERYHERYKLGEDERIDCFVLGKIRKGDYERIRRAVVFNVVQADPGLKKALTERQIDFFNNSKSQKSQ